MLRWFSRNASIIFCAVVGSALAAACLTTRENAEERTGSKSESAACDCEELTVPAEDEAVPEAGTSGGTVTMAVATEPGTLFSMYSTDPSVSRIADHDVLEALTTLDPASGEPLPELAARWESAPGEGTVTFHLVRDARWHDGAPFTAEDVKFTFDQLLDPAGGAAQRGEFLDVREVTVVDPSTISVRLDRDRPELPTSLARVPILPQHVFGTEVVATHASSRAPIGTGPYRFASWKPGVRIELERNTAFRGEAPRCDKLVYRFVSNRRAALELFRSGGVDVVSDLGGVRVGEELSSRGRRISFPREAFVGVVYNTSNPIFSDAATRRALSLLLDRSAIRCSSLRCLAEEIFDPWPRSLARPAKLSRGPFDPLRARRLLESAGWRDKGGDGVRERDGVRLAFRFLLADTDREAVSWVALFEADLAAAGIESSIASVGWGVYTDRLRAHRFDAAIVTTPNARPFDPRALYHSGAIAAQRNFGSFSNPRMDAALEALASAATGAERENARLAIGRILEEEQPMTFAFRPGASMLVRDSIRGVRIRDEWLDERHLWIDRRREVVP